MVTTLLIYLVGLLSLNVSAQQVSYGEYFFDQDPGLGLGFPIGMVAADSVNINLNISNTSLSQGFHTLYIRVRNSAGKWSFFQGRKFFIRPLETTISPKIVAANFFIDSDSGFNAGTTVNFSPADSVVSSAITPTSTLSNGFHKLYMRVQDSLGKWSLYRSMDFDVDALAPIVPAKVAGAEYFYDTDPGLGNGVSVTTPVDDSVDVNTGFNFNSVPGIFHSIYFRTKDSNGVWSHYTQGFMYKDLSPILTVPKIVAAEYFLSHDPGMGNATPVSSFSPSDNIDINCLVSTTGLGFGYDSLYFRVKDSSGVWSLPARNTFKVVDPAKVNDIVLNGDFDAVISPNPVIENTTLLHVQSSEPVVINIRIITTTGVLVADYSSSVYGKQQLLLDVNNLLPGTYFVEITSDENKLVRKFVRL
jgi:hypothetical protein